MHIFTGAAVALTLLFYIVGMSFAADQDERSQKISDVCARVVVYLLFLCVFLLGHWIAVLLSRL